MDEKDIAEQAYNKGYTEGRKETEKKSLKRFMDLRQRTK